MSTVKSVDQLKLTTNQSVDQLKLTTNQSVDQLKLTSVVLIDFFAEWCGPCKMQDPIIEELKKKFADKVEFKKIDVDADNEFTAKYTIHAVPTLILEKDGALFKRYVGVTRVNVLEADINAALIV